MARAPTRNQLPSGYDEEFVNEPEDEILCLICHLLLKEPVLTRCGHRFCKECLEEHFKRQRIQKKATSCHADREGLDRNRDVFPDKATERKILSLVIKCPSDGCDWTGELRNKEAHLASCPFKLVPCSNENCHVTVQRKDLDEHVTITCQWRIIKCDHCSKSHPEYKMKYHIGQCNKFPVTCPNNCGDSIPREMVPKHMENDCLLTITSCFYEQMGCETKVQRRQLDSHLKSTVRRHLDLACVKLKNTEVKLQALERRFDAAKEKIVMVKNGSVDFPGVFVWKIDDFSKMFRQAKTGEKEITECTPFYTENHGYRLKVKVYPDGDQSSKNTHLSVFIVVMKGEYDAILPWPFKKKVKFTVIDQREDPAKRENVTQQFTPDNNPKSFARPTQEENSGYGFTKFISHKKLHSRRYLEDDTLFLQAEIGP